MKWPNDEFCPCAHGSTTYVAETSEGENNTAETQTRTHVLDAGPQIPSFIRQRNSSSQNIYLTNKD